MPVTMTKETKTNATELARRRRHVLLLEKLKAGETLSGRETAELARYEGDQRKRGPEATDRDETGEQRERMQKKRAAERDIEIDFSKQDMRRRARGKRHPEFFLRTYFPHIFYMPFCDNQKHNIKELVVCIKQGGMKAIAAERGGGKTSIMKGLVIWGLLYGYIHWVAWIESNLDMAKDSLEDIKLLFEEPSDAFLEDFPEYCCPVKALDRQSMKARSMTFDMEHLGMKWEIDRLIFPVIKKTPKDTPALGGIIQIFGAEKPIRGLVRAGRRPDFVAINDIETEETARSATMTENIRKNLINAVGGLAGPGQKIGMGMLCTIIRRGCLADTFTDREKYPMWVGERMRQLVSDSTNRPLWEKYIHIRQTSQRAGDPDCRDAEKFYRKNRKAMDEGAKVANKLRYITSTGKDKKPLEISAIQHVFNIIADRGMEYFLCECQNDPPEELSFTREIRAHVIEDKVNGIERGKSPDAERTIAFVDVHDSKLYWAVIAFKQEFIGSVFDYGVEPVHSPIAGSVTQQERKKQVDIAIIEAMGRLHEVGSAWNADLVIVDAGYKDMAVYEFCRESGGGVWRPAKGGSGRSGSYRTPKPSRTIRGVGDGYHWSYLPDKKTWLLIHDPNKWKRFAQDGFLVPDVDAPGSLSLFGSDPVEHRAFAEQIVSEVYNSDTKRFDRVRGLTHNHWLDCVAGCCCGAAVKGIRLMAAGEKPARSPRQKRRMGGYLEGVRL